MKRNLLAQRVIVLLFLFSCSLAVQSQETTRRVLGTFIYKGIAYNYEFTKESSSSYSFLISTISEAKDSAKKAIPETTEEKSAEEKATEAKKESSDTVGGSIFNEFSLEKFEAIFRHQMKVKFDVANGDALKASVSEVFYSIKARLEFLDDEPVTAYLILRKDYIYSLLRSASTSYDGILGKLLVRHLISRVEVETDNGTIKNISAYLVNPDSVQVTNSPRRFLLFKNQFPISISGKFDYEKFSKVNLYCVNCSGIDGLSRYVRLADLALLDIIYENDKEDYSPANKTFSLTPASPIKEMKKEKRSKLLEVTAFSDFVGLDRNEPNGLIQIEARRKIHINTNPRLLQRRKYEDTLWKFDLSDYFSLGVPQTKKRETIYKLYKESDAAEVKLLQRYLQPVSSFRNDQRFDSLVRKVRVAPGKDSAQQQKQLNVLLEKATETFGKEKVAVYAELAAVLTEVPVYFAEENEEGQRQLRNLLEQNKMFSSAATANAARRLEELTMIVKVPNKKLRPVYHSGFSYIEPRLLFSKLEEFNSIIDSAKGAGNKIDPVTLYQYQLASFGLHLQLYKINLPQKKFQWDVLNLGVTWSRSRIALSSDSTGPSKALNSNYWELGSTIIFRPDNRWGASVGVNYLFPRIWNDGFKTTHSRGLFQKQFDGWLQTGNEGKLFFRFRWTYESKRRNNNFAQIQLGYTLNLFAGSNADKKGK